MISCSDDGSEEPSTDGDDASLDGDDNEDDDSDGDAETTDQALELTIMTYNILCYFCDNTNYDPWEDRIGYHRETFLRHHPDLIGVQELFQEEDLNQLLEPNPEYGALYYIDNGDGLFDTYTDAAIFYKKDRFDVVDNGFYWLSDDPETPFSGFASTEEGTRKASRVLADGGPGRYSRIARAAGTSIFPPPTSTTTTRTRSKAHPSPCRTSSLTRNKCPWSSSGTSTPSRIPSPMVC